MSNLLLKNSTFIHVPKCGGTYAASVMHRLNVVLIEYRQPQFGHLYLHQMDCAVNKYNFTFVRHPYTWWPSFWNWSKKDRFNIVEKKCINFDTWIQDYGPFWMGQYTRLVQRYIGDDPLYKCQPKIHFIGKSENLKDDLFTALTNAKEDIKEDVYISAYDAIKSENRWVNRQEYDRNISDTSREIIYNAEKYIFEKFKYES